MFCLIHTKIGTNHKPNTVTDVTVWMLALCCWFNIKQQSFFVFTELLPTFLSSSCSSINNGSTGVSHQP